MSTNNLKENHGNKRRNSEGATDEDIPSKRMRNDDGSIYHPTNREICPSVSRQLSHEDYTIGWICALPLEMAAARAMLDEEHAPLLIPTWDRNVYTLGSISGHNVAIACLPAGVCGLTSATAVGISMLGTFPNSVHKPLMVGIGGGVPSERHDIRLGDVVVSHPSSEQPAVIQYDYGKATKNGVLECKGNLNKPAHGLLNAVASLRAQHDLHTSQIPSDISTAFRRFGLPQHRYPGAAKDVLYEPECEHILETSICELCGPLQQVPRSPRQSAAPIIHYGTIGSGNQVIKHARTRDRFAWQHDILCFEMEAAGLMDHLPCLVIRGVSDYCDSFKQNQFQGYAALAAAAYAKELLSRIPVKQSNISTETPTRNDMETLAQSNDQILEHCKSIMEALNFEEAETRRDTVKNAHSQTCKWILDRPEYVQWLDPDKFYEHNGLLWIKGKPATGKSTIIKYVLKHAEKQRSDNLLVISFFFNARGHDLEKSTFGMYRSLLFQLLSQAGDLQPLLRDIRTRINFDQSNLDLLVRLFKKALGRLRSRKLLCFVDALDECPENQIREMLDTFVQATDIHFLLCFSSRHYPNITVNAGVYLVLEDQEGHSQDLTSYINSELKIGKNKRAESLKKAIFQKSNGIFLWVVLVIGILKRENDRGRVHNMERRLDEIPMELNDLFRDIILRNGHDLAELVLCIQWILYAQRPLLRVEFYFALLSANHQDDLEPWDPEETTTKTMDNYILDCSKGLAELTKAKKPTVQFIHESVREYLFKTDTLVDLYPGFRDAAKGTSHQRLKECCHRWINAPIVKEFFSPYLYKELGPVNSTEATSIREKANSTFPFLGYAAESILFHAEQAQDFQIQQLDFLRTFEWQYWRNVYNVLQRYGTNQLDHSLKNICFSHYLARFSAQSLLQIWWIHITSDGSFAKVLKTLLPKLDQMSFIALYKAKFGSIKTLNDKHMEQVTTLFTFLKHVVEHPYRKQGSRFLFDLISTWGDNLLDPLANTTMVEAARRKDVAVMQLLLDHHNFDTLHLRDILLEVLSPPYPLSQGKPTNTFVAGNLNDALTSDSSIAIRTINCVSILLDRGVSFGIDNFTGGVSSITKHKRGTEPLVLAMQWADASVIQFLLDKQLPLDSRTLVRAFSVAIQKSNLQAAKYLLQRGAQLEVLDQDGDTALHVALTSCDVSIIQLLLDKQPFFDSELLDQAFHVAIRKGRLEVAEYLLQKGVQLETVENGDTALHIAARANNVAAIKFILDHNVNVDLRNRDNFTALYLACSYASGESVDLLIDRGAQVNITASDGTTLLHVAGADSASDPSRVIQKLAELSIQVNARDDHGNTPLHWAAKAKWNSQAGILVLLRLDADIDSRNQCGETPVHYAASAFSIDSLSVLVEKGAQVNLKDHKGKTTLHRLLGSDFISGMESEIDRAIGLLVQAGADLEAIDNYGSTIMHTVLHCIYLSEGLLEGIGRTIFEHGAKAILGPRTLEKDEEWDWMCMFMHKIRSAGRWLSLSALEEDGLRPRLNKSFDFQRQVMILERQNKERLLMDRAEADKVD